MSRTSKLLFTTAIVVAMAGCGAPIGLHPVGQPMVNDDGHSWTRFISAGDCADPQCWSQATGTGVEYTHYVREGGQWVWHTEAPQLRPVTAPGAGYAAAQLIVPSLIQGGATVGAGVLVDSGLQNAARISAYGNYAAAGLQAKGMVQGDQAIGQGLANAKPPVLTNSSINNVQGSVATSASSASAAGGMATATGGMASATGGSVSNTFNPSNTFKPTNINTQFQQQQQQQQQRGFTAPTPPVLE